MSMRNPQYPKTALIFTNDLYNSLTPARVPNLILSFKINVLVFKYLSLGFKGVSYFSETGFFAFQNPKIHKLGPFALL